MTPCSCPTCVVVGSLGSAPYDTIPLKPGIGNELDKSLADKIANFANGMAGTVWRITEAWKPQAYHKARCHINGTCADASLEPVFNSGSFKGDPGSFLGIVPRINKFFTEATKAGLRVVFEVGSEQEKSNLIAAGVKGTILVVKNKTTGLPAITAPHWSVYPN